LIISLLRIIALLIFTFFWLFIGLLLFATKAFAVSTVSNFWIKYWVWDEANTYREGLYFEGRVNVDILNESIYTEILFETLPQIILQTINNFLISQWNFISIFSTIIAGIDLLNGIQRFIYYKVYLRKDLIDIPFQIEFGGITLIDKDSLSDNNSPDLEVQYHEKVSSRDNHEETLSDIHQVKLKENYNKIATLKKRINDQKSVIQKLEIQKDKDDQTLRGLR